MSENVNIDYNNILNHIDLAILSDKKNGQLTEIET